MAETTNKAWPVLGYVKPGAKKGTDPYLRKKDTVDILVAGKKLDTKTLNMSRYLTVYDKDTKEEVVVGKMVKREKDGKAVQYIQFNPGVEFTSDGTKVDSSGFGAIKTAAQKLADAEKAAADNKITEDQLEKTRESSGWYMLEISLSPPKT